MASLFTHYGSWSCNILVTDLKTESEMEFFTPHRQKSMDSRSQFFITRKLGTASFIRNTVPSWSEFV